MSSSIMPRHFIRIQQRGGQAVPRLHRHQRAARTDAFAAAVQPTLCRSERPTSPISIGMIANIDDNVGKLRTFLDELGLTENTIFIFTTDNGTSAGWKVFNAGMRGTERQPLRRRTPRAVLPSLARRKSRQRPRC